MSDESVQTQGDRYNSTMGKSGSIKYSKEQKRGRNKQFNKLESLQVTT